jgi:hypothetical protein
MGVVGLNDLGGEVAGFGGGQGGEGRQEQGGEGVEFQRPSFHLRV